MLLSEFCLHCLLSKHQLCVRLSQAHFMCYSVAFANRFHVQQHKPFALNLDKCDEILYIFLRLKQMFNDNDNNNTNKNNGSTLKDAWTLFL